MKIVVQGVPAPPRLKWHVGGGRMIEQSLPDGGMMASLIVFVSLVGLTGLLVGAWLGSWWEERAARRDAAEDQAAAEAAMFVEELREPDEVTLRRAIASRRTHPVYRQRRTSTAAFLNPPEVAHEWAPPGYAAAGFDVDEEIARIHAAADQIIGWSRIAAAGAPYGQDPQ